MYSYARSEVRSVLQEIVTEKKNLFIGDMPRLNCGAQQISNPRERWSSTARKLFAVWGGVRLRLRRVPSISFLLVVCNSVYEILLLITEQKSPVFEIRSSFWCTSSFVRVAMTQKVGHRPPFSLEVRR